MLGKADSTYQNITAADEDGFRLHGLVFAADEEDGGLAERNRNWKSRRSVDAVLKLKDRL